MNGNRIRRRSGNPLAYPETTIALASFCGCKTEKTSAPLSTVLVDTQADGIHMKTPKAEFLLNPNGSLVGRFENGTKWLTLDETAPSGIVVTSNKQAVSDFARDL